MKTNIFQINNVYHFASFSVIMAKLTDEEVLQILSEGNTSDFEIDEPEGALDMFQDFYAGFAQQARQGNEDDT